MTNKKTITPFSLRAALALLAAVMTIASARAEVREGTWIYNPNSVNSTCVITGFVEGAFSSSLKVLSIPKQLGDYWVISVSDDVMNKLTGLETLIFDEDARITIMPYVKSGASFKKVRLEKANGEFVDNTLPASMTDIGNAFRGTGITSLTMPGVTSIGDAAFEGCNSLTSVTFGQAVALDPSSSPFAKIGSTCTVTYPGPMANWSPYNYMYSPNLVVNCTDGSCGWCGDGWGDGWTNSDNLYKDNSCLYWTLDADGQLTIDCLVQDIIYDDYLPKQVVKTANWDKSKVKSLTLGHVYEYEFGSLSNLTSLSLSLHAANIKTPNHETYLPLLSTIVVDAANLIYDSRDGCNAIIEKATNTLVLGCKDSSIPSTVTTIGEFAFHYCPGLTTIDIPSSVTTIGQYAFASSKNLTSVNIPSSVTSIEAFAFEFCDGLTSISIPSSVTSIGQYVFYGCYHLVDLYFDASKAGWDAVEKGDSWTEKVHPDFKEHWRCTVTYDANGRGTAPAALTGLWSNEAKLTEPAAPTAEGWRCVGWYTDAACTNKWNFDTDIVPGDMTLYAKWVEPCAVTASTDAASIAIPYGQEWTDIPVTLNSLTLGWFQNGTEPVRVADAVAVTPLVGSGAGTTLTFYDGGTTLTARRGAGAHTNVGALSETLTAAGQSATLWVHIPQSTWENAEVGDYTGTLNYDAVFISNAEPAENYDYSLGSEAKVTLTLTIPAAITLSFDANGGTGDAMATVSDRVGHAIQIPACTFTPPAGREFLCWNTKADGTGVRYYAGSEFTPTDSQTTLYAEWGEGYVLDLTASAVDGSVAIPLGLYGQLTQLTGYFNFNNDNGENVPVGFLDLNCDGVDDLALVNGRDVNDNMTASVTKLTSLTANYRFVLTVPSGEGEYGSVLIKFVADGQAVEQPVIESLYDDNGTYNREQLLVLKDGRTHNLMLSGRTLYTDGDWNTLCLPFDIDNFSGTPLDGFTVKELDTETAYDGHVTGVEGTTLYLNFKDATRIEAGKPYIVKKTVHAVHSYTATAGTDGLYPHLNTGYANLIDGRTDTYWGPPSQGSPFCEFHSDVPMYATSYTLTTGNIAQTAKAWTLQAKLNETDDWTTIDTRGSDGDALPSAVNVTKEFTITDPGMYQYYRFVVTRYGGAPDFFTLSDLTLREYANVVNPVFRDVTVTAATREIANPFRDSYEDPEFITVAAPTDVTFAGGKFCGTYDPTEIYNAEHTKYYLGAQNMLYWPTDEGYTVKAFRAYFDLSDGASNVSTMRLGFGDGSATAVRPPLMENGEGSMDNDADAWYDLAGRRLTDRPVTPGIYIVRGRKVVVK